MIALASRAGSTALAELVSGTPLLAFDFDGTLAPIRAMPGDVAMAPGVAAAFAELARRLPVAVITGRSVADVRPRLAGTPAWVIGNHGVEGMPDDDRAMLARHRATCAAWHALLAPAVAALDAGQKPGVFLEDKDYTLCLHYRLAPDREAARRALLDCLPALTPAPTVVAGKCVLNLLPPGAADKFIALDRLAGRMAASGVFFIGDDVTDEAVFERAPAHWLTVKVGAGAPTAARFFVPDQEAVGVCLGMLLDAVASRRAGGDGIGSGGRGGHRQ